MFQIPSPLHQIKHKLLSKHKVDLFIKRDDLIHPEISGNKWRKLKYNIEAAKNQQKDAVLTFGGAYSNHITATAVACQSFGLKSIGIIRGEELKKDSNATLQLASKYGMALRFVSRESFRVLRNTPESIGNEFPDSLIIPEGGANIHGIKGVAELVQELNVPFDHIITSIGTGTTFLGILEGLKDQNHLIGMSSLKGEFIHRELKESAINYGIPFGNYDIHTEFSFGGYGKHTGELIDFINTIKLEIGVLFDPIYTGKAFFGVWKMIQEGIFDNQTVIFLHTGGLQGIAGFNQKSLQKIHY